MRELISTSSLMKRNLMLYLTYFRKFYVDYLLAELNYKFNNCLLLDLGTGSRDPESDYDVNIKSKDLSRNDV